MTTVVKQALIQYLTLAWLQSSLKFSDFSKKPSRKIIQIYQKNSRLRNDIMNTHKIFVISNIKNHIKTTSSSAVEERLHDALCPSVVSFNSVIP